jgi:hypothetical protein
MTPLRPVNEHWATEGASVVVKHPVHARLAMR